MRYKSNCPPAFLMHKFSGFSAIAHSFENSYKTQKGKKGSHWSSACPTDTVQRQHLFDINDVNVERERSPGWERLIEGCWNEFVRWNLLLTIASTSISAGAKKSRVHHWHVPLDDYWTTPPWWSRTNFYQPHLCWNRYLNSHQLCSICSSATRRHRYRSLQILLYKCKRRGKGASRARRTAQAGLFPFLERAYTVMPHITVSYFPISPTCSLPNTFAAYCITPRIWFDDARSCQHDLVWGCNGGVMGMW